MAAPVLQDPSHGAAPLAGPSAPGLRDVQPAGSDTEVTLLELVAAVAQVARTEEELLATVADLVNSGRIRLIGNFRDAHVIIA